MRIVQVVVRDLLRPGRLRVGVLGFSALGEQRERNRKNGEDQNETSDSPTTSGTAIGIHKGEYLSSLSDIPPAPKQVQTYLSAGGG